MDSLGAAVVIGLAVWRLGHLLAEEAGPFGVLTRTRQALGIQHDEDGKPVSWKGQFAEGLMCAWCRGIWLAGALTLVWLVVPLVDVALAAAGVALLAGQAIRG